MDLDLVLEITPEELEEFPEVTETDLVTGVNEGETVVPIDCSQHSLQTFKDHTKDTPQEGGGTHTKHPSHHSPRMGETLQTGASRTRETRRNNHKKALCL